MTLFALMMGQALALDTGWGAHALGTVEVQEAAPNTLGLGGAYALGIGQHLAIEGLGQVAFGGATLGGEAPMYARLRPELRFYTTRSDHPRGGLSVVGGYGLAWANGFSPSASVGLGLDLAWPAHLPVRVETRYELQSPGGQVLMFTAGVHRRPTRAPPPPEPVVVEAPPEPIVEPPTRPMSISPSDAMVWLPHPYCGWWPVEEAQRLAVNLPPDSTLKVAATGYLPAQVTLGEGPLELTLEPAPDQGLLVVLSLPGDELLLNGEPVEVDDRGVALTSAPNGLHQLQVSGGGRSAELTATVSAGYISWLRSPAPEPAKVLFSTGSSTLSRAAQADIRDLADRAGGWHFELLGQASPDGNDQVNARLSAERAANVSAALKAAGVPEDAIIVLPLRPPPVNATDAAALRSCLIRPVRPGGDS